MYDCERTREFLGPYLDNQLETMPTQNVTKHLEQCASCRRELESHRSHNELLARSIKSIAYDTTSLQRSIEAATVRRHLFRFRNLSLSRVPAIVMAGVFIVLLAVASLFYLPGKFSVTLAHPLYQAAASDHLTCSTQSSAPDWILSQTVMAEKARQFLYKGVALPTTVAEGYRLDRGRICQLNGESFLHLVYETADGRQASLFLCSPAGEIPKGQRQESLSGRDVQKSQISGLHIASLLERECLLIAAAREDDVPAAILNLFI